MRDRYDDTSGVRDLLQCLKQFSRNDAVQTGIRFIKDKQFRTADQFRSDRNAFLHAA